MKRIYFNNGEPEMQFESNRFTITAKEGMVYIQEVVDKTLKLKYMIPMTEIKVIEFD